LSVNKGDLGNVNMRRLVVIAAGLLAAAAFTNAAMSQGKPKTCSEAQSACTSQTSLPKECAAEKDWCMKTGSFADPKTRAVSSGLKKK